VRHAKPPGTSARRFLAAFLVCAPAAALRAQTGPAEIDYAVSAERNLADALVDPDRAEFTLAALRSTRDADLAPLFLALARNGDKDQRMFATISLAELAGADAADALRERLRADAVMAIRCEALLQLQDIRAVTDNDLLEALKAPDESLRCLAARGLVEMGRGDAAEDTLVKLTASRDTATAAMARMALLGMGRREHSEALSKLMLDPATPREVVSLLLAQAREQKVAAALPMAHRVATSAAPAPVRALAWQAVCAVSPRGPAVLAEAIDVSKELILRIHLLRALSDHQAGREHLKALSSGRDAVAALARFELLRDKGGLLAAQATGEALRLEHPIVVDYVLIRAGEDAEGRKQQADFYTAPLLDYVRSVPPQPREMQAEHYRAARAATILADMGAPAALAGLREILTGEYSAVVRAAAAGFLKSDNPATCDLVRPLLKSPYDELHSDAMLVLGHFGDASAIEPLRKFLSRTKGRSPAMIALVSWYYLKTQRLTRRTAQKLAESVAPTP